MSSFVTYGDLRQEIEEELDLEDELFIQPLELIRYANSGIRAAEKIINKLCEDYMLDWEPLTLVSGQDTYDLPTGIFANKIRGIVYVNGTRIYEITRKRWTGSLVELEEAKLQASGSEEYEYLVTNDATSGVKLNFYPTPLESGDVVKIWHLRKAKALTLNAATAESEVIDLTEFRDFIKQHMIVKCYKKETHPELTNAQADLKSLEEEMIESLSDRFPDGNNKIEMDFSHYEEST